MVHNAVELALAGTGQYIDGPLSRPTVESIRACLAATNPGWSEGEPYHINCQRCVLAYEVNRRGIPCVALPATCDDDDQFYHRYYEYLRAKSEIVDLDIDRIGPLFSEITKRMTAMGNHSRAILGVAWAYEDSAHVYILENLDGLLICGNPQTGKIVNLAKKLEKVKLAKTKFIRMDRMRFDPEEVGLFARYV
jgi:hypothetical protein